MQARLKPLTKERVGAAILVFTSCVILWAGDDPQNERVAGGDSLSRPAQAPPVNTHQNSIEGNAVRDILSVRRKHDLFEGTVFAELASDEDGESAKRSMEAEFERVLRDVIQQQMAASASKIQANFVRPQTADCELTYNRWLQREKQPKTPDQKLVDSLQRTARLLDRRANRLDDCQEYEEADQLREMADQLRTQSRAVSSRPRAHRTAAKEGTKGTETIGPIGRMRRIPEP